MVLAPHLRLLVLATLVAALLTALSASPARATDIPSGFFGVGGWSYLDDGQAAHLGGAGLRIFRGSLSWDVIEPRPGYRNWSDPDHLAQRAQANGFDIIFVLNGCAAWACGSVS